ncbi:MAG: cadherin-like beta sandwich domain-containing protein, partial [Lentimicrobiaceae bacterium]|nr:cadherin-like beta sandwich domain-containing protein [Lentimicrobiaceae bacterium]
MKNTITASENFKSLKTIIIKSSKVFRNLRGFRILFLLLLFGTNAFADGGVLRECGKNIENQLDGQLYMLSEFKKNIDARVEASTDDATLSSLTADPATLSQAFASNTYTYNATVPYATSSVTLAATATDANATITAADLGSKTLAVGDNQFAVTVTAEDGSTTQVYTVNIRRQSNDATLSSLTADPAKLWPAFSPDIYTYYDSLPPSTKSLTLAATTTDPNASIDYGNLGEKTLYGYNIFSITVTAEDPSYTQVYKVDISLLNATLTSLTAYPATLSSPTFASITQTYSCDATVPYATTSVTLAATPMDPDATITGLGDKTLSVGSNQFTVTSTTGDGSHTATYKVNIYRRQLGNVASLSGLTAAPATLSPAFASDTYTYSATVPYATSSVTLVATATDANATIPPTDLGAKTLAVGSNQFTITATAEDGSTTQVYTVNIYRQSNDATLSSFTADPATLWPAFSPDIYQYYDSLPRSTAPKYITLAATTTDPNASIGYNDLGERPLAGYTIAGVTVTAEDPSYKKSYQITIAIVSDDARLHSLTASPATLSPAFSSDIYTYYDTVPYATTSVTLAATEIEYGTTIPTADLGAKTLAVGSNQFTITATAQDGSTTQVYTVNIYRQSNDATLSSLTASPATLWPSFSSDKYLYYDSLPYATTSVTITATATHANATVTGTGVKTIRTGPNSFSITVTSEDNSTTETYWLHIDRDFGNTLSLSSLTADPATLVPTFASDIYMYKATVPYATTSVTIAATTANANSTIKSADLGEKALAVGPNNFEVNVSFVDEDGWTSTGDYSIDIYRQLNEATLSSLTASPAVLSPAFASDTYTYYDTVPYATSSVTLAATTTDANASIAAADLGAKALSVGLNQFTVTGIAEDSSYTQVYTVNIYRQLNDDASLSGLTAAPATLSPAFSSDTYTYYDTVPYATSSVTLAATATDANATITATDLGSKTLSVGANQFTVTATSQDGSHTQTYTVNIYRKSNDASLSSLIASPFDFTEQVTFGFNDVQGSVPYDTTSITLSATTRDPNASITAADLGVKTLPHVGGNSFTITVTAEDTSYTIVYTVHIYRQQNDIASLSGLTAYPAVLSPAFASDTYTYYDTVLYATTSVTLAATTDVEATVPAADLGLKTLSVGANQFTVTATSQDRSTTQVYTVNIYRKSNDATLSSLTATPAVLSPSFASDVYTYYDTVPYATTSVTLAATATANATITGAGVKTLSVGSNQFTVTVTAEDDSYTQTYTINIYRQSNDATISSLTASPAVLSPSFASNTYTYYTTVPYATTSVTLAATATDADAIITGAGEQTLAVGENQFTITVTAEDGSTTQTYTIHIHRQSNDATLSSLTADPATLSPSFASDIYTYYDTVPYATTSVTLEATATNIDASFIGDFGEQTLSVGANQFTFTLTAEDWSTTQTYTINIYRQSNDATLSALTASPATLSPAFASDVYTYYDTVPYATTSVTLAATATANATITGAGVKTLSVGSNQFTVTVTAEDDSYTQTYTINIYRQSNDATISSLTADPATLSPSFASDVYTYYDTVPYATTSVT